MCSMCVGEGGGCVCISLMHVSMEGEGRYRELYGPVFDGDQKLDCSEGLGTRVVLALIRKKVNLDG